MYDFPVVFLFFFIITHSLYKKVLVDEFTKNQNQTVSNIANNINQIQKSIVVLGHATATSNLFVDNLLHYDQLSDYYEKMVFINNMHKNLSEVAYSDKSIVSTDLTLKNLEIFKPQLNGVYQYSDYKSFAKAYPHGVFGWIPTRASDLPVDTFVDNILSFYQHIYSGFLFGDEIGMLVINIDEKTLFNELEKSNKSGINTIYVVDNEGSILTSTNRGKVGEKLSVQERTSLIGNMNKNGIVSSSYLDDVNWRVVAVANYADVILPITQLEKKVGCIAILVMFLSILINAIISFFVSSPIVELTQIVQHFGSKNFYPITPKRTLFPEINILNYRFVEMFGVIERLIQQIRIKEKQKRKKEFEVLQAQINPHFLYNTLESINWMAIENNQPKISEMSILLGSFLRLSLSEGKVVISVRDELQQLTSYMEIQRIRYDEKINFTIDIPHEVLETPMVKLLLQPLVENSILHGFDFRKGQGSIFVKVRKAGNKLVISIQDDGCGIPNEKLALISSPQYVSCHGLGNVKKRIELYYGEQYGMKIDSTDGKGTLIVLTLGVDISELEVT